MAITFSEVLDSYRPRRALEISWDTTASATKAGFRDIYLIGGTNSGTMSDNDIEGPVSDAEAALAYAGADSTLYYMYNQVTRGGRLKNNVYLCAAPEPAASVAASQTYTFANNVGVAGTWTVNVAGAVFSFTVSAGDTPTEAGTAFVAAFDALSDAVKPPAAAVNAIGTVTVTMTNDGTFGNSAPAYKIVTGSEPTTQTLTVGGSTFASGTNEGVLTTLLANLSTVKTPLIVSQYDDLTAGNNVDLIMDHIITKSDAESMLSSNLVACMQDTAANLVTGVNNIDTNDAERFRLAGVQGSGSWTVAIACWVANALGSETNITRPFDGVALPYMVAPPSAADVWTNTELDTLLEGGVTPIHYNGNSGDNEIVRGIVGRTFSGVPMDWAVVDGVDYFRYACDVALSNYSNYKLGEDGETNLDALCITPNGILDVVKEVAYGDDMKGILRNLDTLLPQATAEINTTYSGRVDFKIDVAIFDGLHIIAGLIRQRSGVIG